MMNLPAPDQEIEIMKSRHRIFRLRHFVS